MELIKAVIKSLFYIFFDFGAAVHAHHRRAAVGRYATGSLFAHTFSRFAAFGTALRAALRIASPVRPSGA